MPEQRNVQCVHCQTLLAVAVSNQMVQIRCPKCGTLMNIPASSGSVGSIPDEFDFTRMPTTFEPAPGYVGPRPPVPQPSPTRQASPVWSSARQPTKRRGTPTWVILVIALVVMPIVFCGVGGIALLIYGAKRAAGTQVLEKGVDAVPLPDSFPELGPIEQTFPSGVKSHFVRMVGTDSVPGSQMTMRVYLPPGELAAQSLACVFITPAGTPLIHGTRVELGDDYHDETLPYAEAGMVVIQYSLDGAMTVGEEAGEWEYTRELQSAYRKFRDSGAGVINGRNAIEFAIQRLPMVDPKKFYTAGHSSAGNVSLLLAAYEPRVARCAAYAAAYDLEIRMSDMTSDANTRRLLPGIQDFVSQSSPLNHIADYRCPLWVFHATGDKNVPYQDAKTFVAKLNQATKRVTFYSAPGDHYGPMLDEGIPNAIAWFKE